MALAALLVAMTCPGRALLGASRLAAPPPTFRICRISLMNSGLADAAVRLVRQSHGTVVECRLMQANSLISVQFDTNGVQSLWRKLISSPDVLRQRPMLALTDLFVVNTGATQLTYRGAAAAYYLDQFEANAFGTFKGLLLAVSHNAGHGAISDLSRTA